MHCGGFLLDDGCNKNASSNNNAEKLKNEQMPVNLFADTSKNCRIIAPLLSRSPFKNPSRQRCKSTPQLHLHFVAIRRGRKILQSGYLVATDLGKPMRWHRQDAATNLHQTKKDCEPHDSTAKLIV